MTETRNWFDWTDGRIETLKAMWNAGDTTSAIGEELGCPRNAVIGKAHRLKLESRPSPIKLEKTDPEIARAKRRQAADAAYAKKRARKHNVAREHVVTRAVIVPVTQTAAAAKGKLINEMGRPVIPEPGSGFLSTTSIARSTHYFAPPDANGWDRFDRRESAWPKSVSYVRGEAVKKRSSVKVVDCRWPLGEPGTKAFRFCSDPSLPGCGYCSVHDGLAHYRPSPQQRSAA